MWQHWNSFWAPGPGDPPAVDDPALWQAPWSTEQAIALQARQWETFVSASRSWWTMLLSAWPVAPAWPVPGWVGPALGPFAAAGIEPLAPEPEVTPRAASPRKRAAARKR